MSELIRGGHFLVRPLGDLMMCPERFTDEQREFMRTGLGFIKHQVVPKIGDIEAKNLPLLRELIAKAGELGLLMTDVPEAFDGLGLDKTTSMILTEVMNGCGSWAVTYGAQVGIGMLPIVFFGNDEQRQKYLPKLSTGEWVGAYALTEAGAGSDALNIRTKAVEDGDHYVLNGTKQWITNAGIADVFTVFAKVGGDKFTGFIVERGDPGVSIGPEEHKLGLRGSSTCEVILEDARIPKDRILGRIGRGHRIAFGILFFGRLKLGIGAIGGSKEILDKAIAYAKERKQFDRTIVEFGLIREKLARIAARLYACEAMGYRTSGLIDDFIATPPARARSKEEHTQSALEEYGIESAILKVYGSELLDFAIDETMQVYGGYGYTEHYDIERIYRDSRINRIFEGTNEINRLLISGTLIRRGKKGQLPLAAFAEEVMSQLQDPASLPTADSADPLGAERAAVERLKRLTAWAGHVALSHNQEPIDQRQDILGTYADMLTDTFAADSSVQRTAQMIEAQGAEKASVARALTTVVVDQSCTSAATRARQLLACVLDGDALDAELKHVDTLSARRPVPLFERLEEIAAWLSETETYRMPA